MIIGKDLDEVKKITNKDIADQLGGLPAQKLHCSVLAEEAIKKAYETVETVKFDNAYYRKDIGKRALMAERN